MLMLVRSMHLLSFPPQILPNGVSRIPYTRRIFKLSPEEWPSLCSAISEQLGKVKSAWQCSKSIQRIQTKELSSMCTAPCIGCSKWSHGRSLQIYALQLKDNFNCRKYRCSWAGFCSDALGCYVEAIPRAVHYLHVLRKVLPHPTAITHVKPLCLCSTRNQSQIIFFPTRPGTISICKIRLQ